MANKADSEELQAEKHLFTLSKTGSLKDNNQIKAGGPAKHLGSDAAQGQAPRTGTVGGSHRDSLLIMS